MLTFITAPTTINSTTTIITVTVFITVLTFIFKFSFVNDPIFLTVVNSIRNTLISRLETIYVVTIKPYFTIAIIAAVTVVAAITNATAIIQVYFDFRIFHLLILHVQNFLYLPS